MASWLFEVPLLETLWGQIAYLAYRPYRLGGLGLSRQDCLAMSPQELKWFVEEQARIRKLELEASKKR